jgi:hypothetical protein
MSTGGIIFYDLNAFCLRDALYLKVDGQLKIYSLNSEEEQVMIYLLTAIGWTPGDSYNHFVLFYVNSKYFNFKIV